MLNRLKGLVELFSIDKLNKIATVNGVLNFGANANAFKVTNAITQRAIDIQVTPNIADRQLYMDIDYGTNNKEAAYIISSSAKTSGDTTALRARGQAKAAGASTAEIRGVHAQGIAYAALYAGTVNALYAEAIAKDTSTVTTIRGAMVACDSEGTPTSITNMYGLHVRIKSSVAPGTDFIPLLVESEKFGSGVLSGAAIKVKDTTWGAAETSFTVGLYFNTTGIITTGVHFDAPVATGIKFDNAGTTRAIDIQVTPTSADRQLYMVIDYAANVKEACYVIAKSAKTTGELIAIRGRAEHKAVGAVTGEARGGFFQGISFANLYGGTCTGVQSEAIAKDATTVLTIRGAFFEACSEGTPTSIGSIIGGQIRVKTAVVPGTLYVGCRIETEEFMGSFAKADALLDFKSTNWASNREAVTAIIDMGNFIAKASHAHIRFPLAAMDNDSSTEGDFWYDSAAHVFKYYNGSSVKTIQTD